MTVSKEKEGETMLLHVKEIEEAAPVGVRFAAMGESQVLKKEHFEWTSFPLETALKTNQVVSGLLQGWHRTLRFDTVEYHGDAENFFFLEGECVMLFCERREEQPLLDTACLVHIRPGTQVEVKAGICHYVPIALTDTFKAYVFTPLQDSILLSLPEPIEACQP